MQNFLVYLVSCLLFYLGSYGQNGSLSSASPVYANARAREPPQMMRCSQRPHLPLNSFGLCKLLKMDDSRYTCTTWFARTLPTVNGKKPAG